MSGADSATVIERHYRVGAQGVADREDGRHVRLRSHGVVTYHCDSGLTKNERCLEYAAGIPEP